MEEYANYIQVRLKWGFVHPIFLAIFLQVGLRLSLNEVWLSFQVQTVRLHVQSRAQVRLPLAVHLKRRGSLMSLTRFLILCLTFISIKL